MPRPVRLIRPSFDHRETTWVRYARLFSPAVSWASRESSVNSPGKVARTAVQSIIAPRGPRFNAPARSGPAGTSCRSFVHRACHGPRRQKFFQHFLERRYVRLRLLTRWLRVLVRQRSTARNRVQKLVSLLDRTSRSSLAACTWWRSIEWATRRGALPETFQRSRCCTEVLMEAVERYGDHEIFNTDSGQPSH